jgi:hypothetical protein
MRSICFLFSVLISCSPWLTAVQVANAADRSSSESSPSAISPDSSNGAKYQIKSDVTIMVSEDESAPVRHAAEDLASDFKKVFGKEVRVINKIDEAGPATVVIDRLRPKQQAKGNVAAIPAESFCISAGGKNINGVAKEVINLSGADIRGTIYAIYEFSEDFLGIDPMYLWTDKVPLHKDEIEIPLTFSRQFGPPVFRYRGFFINDEDLLTGWAPGDKDHTGISLQAWDNIYETLLRLKANMVVPGSWIFPNEPQTRLAAERGLAVSIHHATPLDLNVARWPKDVPYNYTTHPEILEQAWTNAVNAFPKDQEILWEVGLRGLADESYASLDSAVRGNDQASGALISKAISKQIEIVKSSHPGAVFVTNLWAEGSRLMERGYLKIPDEVITVWADNGWGRLQDHTKVKAGQGAYYHVAMYNLESNQLSEMVPVPRIFDELGRFQSAGATRFLLVNTSDIRPVAMTAKACMNFAWHGREKMASSDRYYHDWSSTEFGAKVADELPALYRDYFDAPAKMKAATSEYDIEVGHNATGMEYGDMIYHYHARELLLSAMVKRPLFLMAGQGPLWRAPHMNRDGHQQEWVTKTMDSDQTACQEAAPRWEKVWQKAQSLLPEVEPQRRDYYRAQLLTMIEINRQSNEMLLQVIAAVRAIKDGDKVAAKLHLAKAKDAVKHIKSAEAWGEYGKWKNWYSGDWLTGVDRTAELIDIATKLQSDPKAPIPVGVMWNEREAYEHIMGYEGERTVDLRTTQLPKLDQQ